MTAVRSSTLLFQARSRLRCCTGVRCALTMMTSGSSALASWAISSTLPLPNRVAGVGLARGATCAATTSRWIAAVSPTASASRASASRSAASARPRLLGSTWMTKARLLKSAFGRLVLKLDRAHRHHGRDRVLVDQLGLTVPAQQHAEIVEPGDVALQLDAVDQEEGHGRFALADRV